jgi:hypothetical protein
MRGTVVEIRYAKRECQQTLPLDRGTRDALAEHCRRRFPHHRAKLVAREWDLSLDEARGVIAGRTSLTTYDKIKKAGGWPVIFAVEAMVIGQGADQFLIELRASYHESDPRIAALGVDLWPVPDRRRSDPDRLGASPADRHQPRRRRVGEN